MRVLNSLNAYTILLIIAAIGGAFVPSCSKKSNSSKDPIAAMRQSLLFETGRYSKYWPTAPITYHLVPKMEAAARFLEGRKSIDVPYVVSASLYPAQAPDTGLTLAVFWMETGYAAASPHFYIEGEVYDVPFPVSAVREDRSPLLEDVERQLTLQGTLRADCIELHISGESSAGMGTQSIPVEFITGQALLSVCTQIGRKSNSTDVFIHHDVLRMVEEDPK